MGKLMQESFRFDRKCQDYVYVKGGGGGGGNLFW